MSLNLYGAVSLMKTAFTFIAPTLKMTAMTVQMITSVVIELLALINSVQGMTMLVILVALYFHAPQQFRILGSLTSFYVAGKEIMSKVGRFMKMKAKDMMETNTDTQNVNKQSECCEDCIQDFFSQFEDRFDSKIQKLKDFFKENPQQLVILSDHLKSRSKDDLIDENLFQTLLSNVG